jgi:3-hydroxyisobutyrate dehydrogenase-like beta-hydroxyacid dehydrogenase
MTGWDKRIETGDLTTGWPLRRVLKDLALGAELCSELKFDAPVFATALRAFQEVGEAGHMESDLTALYTAKSDTRR